MRASASKRYRQEADAHGWAPPRQHGANKYDDDDTTGRYFLYNEQDADGDIVSEISEEGMAALESELFCTLSIYYVDYRFFAVPYDATKHGVGPESKDNKKAEEEDDEVSNHGDFTEDWGRLGFNHVSEPNLWYVSRVVRRGDQHRLQYQRQDQRWARSLLPENHRCGTVSPSTDGTRPYGGLIGDLAAILGLIAFSVPPASVEAAMEACLRADRWRGSHVADQWIGRGWIDRRGVVVKIWAPTMLGTSPADLDFFERGGDGKILDWDLT